MKNFSSLKKKIKTTKPRCLYNHRKITKLQLAFFFHYKWLLTTAEWWVKTQLWYWRINSDLCSQACACVSTVQKITCCNLSKLSSSFLIFSNIPNVVSEIKCYCNLYKFSKMSESRVWTNKLDSVSRVLWLLSLHSQLLVPRLNFEKHLKHFELDLMKTTSTYSAFSSALFFGFFFSKKKRNCKVFFCINLILYMCF